MVYIARNSGKQFEDDFQKSIPDYCWIKRLNDNAASWSGGNATRFSSNNECDFLLSSDKTKTLYALELKSTISGLNFWREDFEKDKTTKSSFNIKKNQILGLQKFNQHHLICGFIFNFRSKNNRTFFVNIEDFLSYTNTLNKKSINLNDVLLMNPIEISSRLLKVHYRYDIIEFLDVTESIYG